jgi:hypothetical protein
MNSSEICPHLLSLVLAFHNHNNFTDHKFPVLQYFRGIQSGILLLLMPHILKIHSFYLKYFIQVKMVKCVTNTEI